MTFAALPTKPSFDAVPTPLKYLGTVTATVSTVPCALKAFHCANRNAAQRYFQVFNGPTATGTPDYQWSVPAGGQVVLGTDMFTAAGWNYTAELTVGISTTSGTYVAATAADHDFAVSIQ